MLGLFPGTPAGENAPSFSELLPDPLGNEFYGIRREKDWREFAENDALPVPPPPFREGYIDDIHYFVAGVNDYLRVKDTLDGQGFDFSKKFEILDFGCSTGRFLRHLFNRHPTADCSGCDINESHIEWMNRHMPQVKAFQSTIMPHLPCKDESFDVITAFSIFTHINEFELTWFLELVRILKPGGYLYLSVATDTNWLQTSPDSAVYRMIAGHDDLQTDLPFGPKLFKDPMPRSKVVFKYTMREIYSCDVFLHRDYLRRNWGKYVDVVNIHPNAHDTQDVFFARKQLDR